MLTLIHQQGKDSEGNNYHAHAGFLASAKAMVPDMVEAITKAVADYQATRHDDPPGPLHLVFTGHSAGGAVAAMLYAHFMKPQAIAAFSAVSPRNHPLLFPSPSPLSPPN